MTKMENSALPLESTTQCKLVCKMWYLPSSPCLISSSLAPFCSIFAPSKFVSSNFSCTERTTALVTSAFVLLLVCSYTCRIYMDCHFYAFWDQTTKMVHINMNLFDDLLYAVFLVKVQSCIKLWLFLLKLNHYM